MSMTLREAIRYLERKQGDDDYSGVLFTNRGEYNRAVATLKELVPKQYGVKEDQGIRLRPFIVMDTRGDDVVAYNIPTREVAERIAAEYEEAAE